jgi:prepilin-type processing-associated H-X9-DG protein
MRLGGRLPVLYMKKIESIKNPSRLLMAGDTTSVYPQGYTLTDPGGTKYGPHYFTFFTHDDKKPVCNLLFVDGHVTLTTMRDPPHHIVNSIYSLVLEGTPKSWYGVSGP